MDDLWKKRPKLGTVRNNKIEEIYERAQRGEHAVSKKALAKNIRTLRSIHKKLDDRAAISKGPKDLLAKRMLWVEDFGKSVDPTVKFESSYLFKRTMPRVDIDSNSSNNTNTDSQSPVGGIATTLAPPMKEPDVAASSSNMVDEPVLNNTNEGGELPDEAPGGPYEYTTEDFTKKAELHEDTEKNTNYILCKELFDPCTREPIENIGVLEQRVKEIKKILATEVEEVRPLPAEVISRLDLLLYLLNQPATPTEDILQFRGAQIGQFYEALWDIAFAIGSLYERTSEFFLVNGKAEEITSLEGGTIITDPVSYLERRNVNMGASGASDITFGYRSKSTAFAVDPCSSTAVSIEGESTKPCLYFCSSKYYKRDESKGVEKFDIQKIYTAAKNLHIDYDVKIILVVKNRSAVEKKLKRAISRYIAEEASAVYGTTDLIATLTRIYDQVKIRTRDEPVTVESLRKIFNVEEKPKPVLTPRLHQDMAIFTIGDAIKQFISGNGGITNNKFLIGILPRGGKTYIAGGLVTYLQPKRVVVLLGAKSETITQFRDELFSYYQDFNDYNVVDVLEGKADTELDPSQKYIFIMSVELYKTEITKRKLLMDLKGGAGRADLFICDEAHLKQTTQRAVKAVEDGTENVASDKDEQAQLTELEGQISKSVPVVYMTGTYIKPRSVFKIPVEHTFVWEYQDIQAGKKLAEQEEYFKGTFGEVYDRALAKALRYGETYETIQAMYRRFPELILLSTNFTEGAKQAFLTQGEAGFPTLVHLFSVKKEFNPTEVAPENWHTGFTNPRGVARLINYLSPGDAISDQGGEPVEPISSVMKRVDKISQRMGDRLAFFTSEFVPHSQLWFLPSMQGHPLIKRMAALAGVVFQSEWYRKYFSILAVSSSQDWGAIPGAKGGRVTINGGEFAWTCPNARQSLKDCILEEERRARDAGKGLVILAQNMLHLGISLACVDIVVLLDDSEKVDERIQKMYRALTESVNKRAGYIIDLNYFRSVVAIMQYQVTTTRLREKKNIHAHNISDEFNKILNIFRIDDDLPIYEGIEEGTAEIQKDTIPELQSLMTRSGHGDGMILGEAGRAMNYNIEAIIGEDYNSSFDDMLGELDADLEAKRVLRAGEEGVAVAEENEEERTERAERGRPPPILFPDEIASNPVAKRQAFLDIFKTAMKIGVFGTDKQSLDDYIREIEINDELFDTVFDTLLRRGAINESADRDIVRALLVRELQKIVAKGKGDSYTGMKESFNTKGAREEKFQEVLTYIVEHLAPKDKERHKFGEVFTPLTLVDEMLSKLPAEAWTHKDWKWLDPANGIGNFPIKAFIGQAEGEHTYPGLFEGLRKAIPDDKARCKHIIENMLYMVDINGKNNMIARRLFEKLCPGAKANIEQIDKKNGFLADKPLKFNGKEVKEFDVIMGNPPYQGGSIRAMSTRETRKKRDVVGFTQDKHKNLWIPMTEKSLKILKKGGYLSFIMPIGWFKPDKTGIHNTLLSKQIHFIRIIFNTDAKRLFSGSGEINMAHFLIENKAIYKETEIVDIYMNKEKISLKPDSILSMAYNSIFTKIQKKSTLFKDSYTYNTNSIPNNKCNPGSYKQIHRITDKGDITYIEGNVEHPNQNVPKFILNGAKFPRYYYDKKGEYGLIGSHQHYFIGENLNKIEEYFKTKLSALLLSNIKYDMKFIDPKYYPDVRELPLDKINDETLADYFEFTKEERAAIAATEYPKREYKFKEITCAQLKGEKEPAEGGGEAPHPHNKTRKARRT